MPTGATELLTSGPSSSVWGRAEPKAPHAGGGFGTGGGAGGGAGGGGRCGSVNFKYA